MKFKTIIASLFFFALSSANVFASDLFTSMQTVSLDTEQVAYTLVRNFSPRAIFHIEKGESATSLTGSNNNEMVDVQLVPNGNNLAIDGHAGDRDVHLAVAVINDQSISVNGYIGNKMIGMSIDNQSDIIHVMGSNKDIQIEATIVEDTNVIKMNGHAGQTDLTQSYTDKKMVLSVMMRLIYPTLF